MRLHETCLENRSIRSLDALMSDQELDIDARDKVCLCIIPATGPHCYLSILEWKDTFDSCMPLSSF
jgi:hypothetical protein